MQTANPRTGYRYTVREAYELVSGRSAQKSQDLTAASNGVRTQSKQAIGNRQQLAGDIDGNGELSEAEALKALANLGFE